MARDVTLDRILAITVLREHLADKPTLVDRFLEAERQAAALFHPNLVIIFDVGATDGLCWSAHEYCGGGQLPSVSRPVKPFQPGRLSRC